MPNIYVVNLILCLIILVLGSFVFRKNGDKTYLYIALAFGLFGLSHLAYLVGAEQSYSRAFLVIRTTGYLLIVFALLKAIRQ